MKDFTKKFLKGGLTILLSGIAFAGWSQKSITAVTATTVTATTATLTWTESSTGSTPDYIVILADVAPITANLTTMAFDPSIAPTTGLDFGAAPFLSGTTGPKIVYSSTDALSKTVTNLAAATGYYYAVYSWKATGTTWSDSGGSGAGTGQTIGPIQLASTITGSGGTIALTPGATNVSIFTLDALSNGAQTLDQLVFKFSVDVATIFNTSNFKLKIAGSTVGTAVYAAGTKTLTVSGIGASIGTSKTLTLFADVLGTAAVSSQTVALTTADVSVTGGGVVTAFTTITNTLNVSALTATVAAVSPGTAPVVANPTTFEAGVTQQAIAGFRVTSSATQNLTNVNFHYTGLASQFSTISLYKNSSSSLTGATLVNTDPSGSFDLTATPEAITTTTAYYFLVVDVNNMSTTATAPVTVTQAQTDLVFATGTSGGTFSTTNTLNFRQSNNSSITLSGSDGTSAAITYASFSAASGLTTGNSQSLANFDVKDGNDNDGLGTTITSVTIQVGANSNVKAIAIFDGSTNIGEATTVGSSVTFTGLTLTAGDNATKTFNIRATFNTVVNDNDLISVSVSAAVDVATSSRLKSSGAFTGAVTPAGVNKIDVTATKFLASATTPVNPTPNLDFAVNIKAVDINNNIDVDRTNTVTLSISSGPGSISAASSDALTESLSSGQFTWTHLRLTNAGTINVNAHYGGSGISDLAFPVIVKSNGVLITPATTANICYGGDFVMLTPIVITESDVSDFGVGNNQLFYLELPSGFIFDTSVTAAPAVTGGDISSPSALSYIGNTIVRFSYSISGITNSDKFTISGLKVRYPITTASAGTIKVINSSAQILGDAESDNRNHGSLNGVQSAPGGFAFEVAQATGGPTVNATDTRFDVGVNAVKLVGTPAGAAGVFSGNGITKNASGEYIFSPSQVGAGTYAITFTYTDPAAPHCVSVLKKDFDVATSQITNLQIDNCQNGPKSIGLAVPQAYLDSQTGTTGYSVSNFYIYTYHPIAGGYVFDGIVNLGTTFDPSLYGPTYEVYRLYGGGVRGVYLYYDATKSGFSTYTESVFVAVKDIPAVALSFSNGQATDNFCSTSLSITLNGIPAIANNATDFFSTDSQAGTDAIVKDAGSSMTWRLTPANAGAGSATKTTYLTYTYQDPNSGCSATTLPRLITFNPTPAVMNTTDLTGAYDRTICVGDDAPTYVATGDASVTYTWYNDADGKLLRQDPKFIPSTPDQLNNKAAGATKFDVTQTIAGCESAQKLFTINVKNAPKALTSQPAAICAGSDIILTGNTFLDTDKAKWTTNGKNKFVDSVFTTSPANTTYKYTTPEVGSSVSFTLTALQPTGADVGTCPASTSTFFVTVNAIPDKPIINEAPQVSYCVGETLKPLTGTSPIGGAIQWYDDNAGALGSLIVTSPTLNLSFSNASPITKTYHATQVASGCAGVTFATATVVINPKPVALFTADLLCNPSSTKLDASSSTIDNSAVDPLNGPNVIQRYEWSFPSVGSSLPSSDVGQTVNHVFPVGSSDVQLIAYSNKLNWAGTANCSTTIKASEISTPINPHLSGNSALLIGNYPIPKIAVKNQCQDDMTIFSGTDQNNNVNPDYVWDFGDGSATATGASVTHPYATAQDYDAKLKITSTLGCTDSVVRSTYILPLITVFNLKELFDAANGWKSEALGNIPSADLAYNSWNRIDLSGATTATIKDLGHGNAWITNDPVIHSYHVSERSVLNTPCFAMPNVPRPALSFDYWDDTQPSQDGVYIEYLDDTNPAAVWTRLGTASEAELLNWYDLSQIQGLAPLANSTEGQLVGQLGWSGSTPGWTTAKYSLDGVSTIAKLRLRFFFGSNNNALPNTKDGFALDNFLIASRNRVTLAENFTNQSATGASVVNQDFRDFNDVLTEVDDPELVKIQYHTNIGGADSLYANNPSDQQARATFYGVTTAFKGLIDGVSAGTVKGGNWADSYEAGRSLIPAPLKITVNILPSPITGQMDTVIRIGYEIKQLSDIPSGQYLIQVALVERNGDGEYNLRKLLPNANGTLLNIPTGGDTQTGTVTSPSSSKYKTENLRAIVFVQDLGITTTSIGQSSYEFHNVVQAGVSKVDPIKVITGIENIAAFISAYPNPSNQEFTLALPYEADKIIPVKLYDAMGRTVSTTEFPKGISEITMNTSALNEGVYIVQFKVQSQLVRRKIIVLH